MRARNGIARGGVQIGVELRAPDRLAADVGRERLPERTVPEVLVPFPRGLVSELVPSRLANLVGLLKVAADADLRCPRVLVDDEGAERDACVGQEDGAGGKARDDGPGTDLLVKGRIQDVGRSHVLEILAPNCDRLQLLATIVGLGVRLATAAGRRLTHG